MADGGVSRTLARADNAHLVHSPADTTNQSTPSRTLRRPPAALDRRDHRTIARAPTAGGGQAERVAATIAPGASPRRSAIDDIEEVRSRIVPTGDLSIRPDARIINGTARVTPDVAGSIIRNIASGHPGFRPETGLGGASWFLTEGTPHTGIDAGKNVSIPATLRPPADRLVFREAELTTIFNRIRDSYDMPDMERRYREYYHSRGTTVPEGPLSNRHRDGMARWLTQRTERLMWEEVGQRVARSSAQVGEVILEGSRFSRHGNGRFMVVADAARVVVRGGVQAVMRGLRDAGLAAEPGVVEAAERAASRARWTGRVQGAFRIGGRVLLVVGAAADTYRIVTATDKARTITEVAGGWAGAAGAAAAFSAFYAPADVAGPLAWAGHGVGALVAGGLGYWAGSTITRTVYDLTFDP